jgi:hypothetical protein
LAAWAVILFSIIYHIWDYYGVASALVIPHVAKMEGELLLINEKCHPRTEPYKILG